MRFEKCSHPVRCWDYHIRYCLRPKGHVDDGNPNCHNPFSSSAPPKFELLTMKRPIHIKNRELVSA